MNLSLNGRAAHLSSRSCACDGWMHGGRCSHNSCVRRLYSLQCGVCVWTTGLADERIGMGRWHGVKAVNDLLSWSGLLVPNGSITSQ